MLGLLKLADEQAYRQHFSATYVRGNIQTRDNVRVYFSLDKFDHAFFESSRRDGVKDVFSIKRCERMDWILPTLTAQNAQWYQGYVRKGQSYDKQRSVAVAYDDFVVVLAFSAKKDGTVKANFVTCYDADNSIGKIRQSPAWTLQDCKVALGIV